MKTIYFIAIIILLIFLDWLAIHDIRLGDENLVAEYGMLALSGVILVFLILLQMKTRNNRKEPEEAS